MSAADATSRYDVFLCHNSSEEPAVRALKFRLAELGLSVWLDVDDLRPGLDWMPGIEAALRASESVAVLVGSDGLGPWQEREAGGIETTLWDRASGRVLQTTTGGMTAALDGGQIMATSGWSNSVEHWKLAYSVAPSVALKRQIQSLASVLPANGAMIPIVLLSTNATARPMEATLPAELPLQIRSASRAIEAVFKPDAATMEVTIAPGESLRTSYLRSRHRTRSSPSRRRRMALPAARGP